MANTEILAAIREFQSKIEGQILATNATLKEFMSSFDFRFADLLSTSPSPAEAPAPASSPASFPVFRSGGSPSAPPQRRLPTAPFQAPGSFDLGVKTPGISVTRDTGVDSSRIASTVDGLLLPVELFGKAPSPSPAPEPAPEVTPPPDIHLRPLPPPSPPTTPSASPSPTKAAMFPPPTTTSPKLSNLIVLAHNIEVGRILGIILWPSPSDMEAQSSSFNKYQDDDVAVASRRGVIFSLYALEEVYKDIFESQGGFEGVKS